MTPDTRLNRIDAIALLIIAGASIIGINQYVYGMYNHYITIPFIKSIINPELYPGDYLIAEKKYFYTYFNTAFALLSKSLRVSLPVLFFTFYCFSLYATLIAFFKIAMTLFKEKAVAYFSVIFLIFSFTTLGEVKTIESLFLERTLVLPILLFGIYFFLHKKFVLSYALAGAAFLFHPLSAVYVIACLLFCSVFLLKEIGIGRFALCLLTLGAMVSPVFYLKFQNPAPPISLLNPDSEWLELLRLRLKHHIFPSSWDTMLIIQALLFITGFQLCRKHRPEAWNHRVVMLFCGGVLLLCLAGTFFIEVFPISLAAQFQLFRSFVFLIYFALIYYANFFFRESVSQKDIFLKLIVFACFAVIFYDLNVSPESKRLMKFGSFLVVAIAVFPFFGFMNYQLAQFRKFYFPALLTVVLALGIAGGMARGNFSIQTAQEKNWLDIQRWAKESTPTNSAFIIAPVWEGFRVESERTIYGDWKDGTQMLFNPEFGTKWILRMKRLGFDGDDTKLLKNYNGLAKNELSKTIFLDLLFDRPYSKMYMISPLEHKNTNYREVYSNKKFVVYEIWSRN